MSPRRGLLALLLLCSIVVTACGGDNTISARAAAPRLTKETYVVQANAICSKMNDAIAALGNPDEDDTTIAQYAEYVEQWTGIVRSTLRELRALPAPTGDEATLRDVYIKVDTVLADGIALSDALRDEDKERYEEIDAKITESTDAANAASIAYGMNICGE